MPKQPPPLWQPTPTEADRIARWGVWPEVPESVIAQIARYIRLSPARTPDGTPVDNLYWDHGAVGYVFVCEMPDWAGSRPILEEGE